MGEMARRYQPAQGENSIHLTEKDHKTSLFLVLFLAMKKRTKQKIWMKF
jgi:hypothetical protein